jgi:hypothetical protein
LKVLEGRQLKRDGIAQPSVGCRFSSNLEGSRGANLKHKWTIDFYFQHSARITNLKQNGPLIFISSTQPALPI